MADVKLSRKQNDIIWCLQNGWDLITDRENNFITCCTKELQFNFGLRIFFNLVAKDLIYQEQLSPHDFILTDLGKKIKTRQIEI